MNEKIGKIITFYSYKGGTGRSMALANIGWILASNGKKVLVIDWDLEAPGLHRYYSPFLQDKELRATDGLIDFLFEYVNASLTKLEEKNEDWYLPYTDLSRYTTSLINTNFLSSGTIDFVPAGRQDTNYAYKVNTFDWMVFYEKLKGGAFLDIVKGQIKKEYDYILIDSRTGVSDTSGICTIQIPDSLVACFTYNIQSIDGVSAVLNSIVKQRQENRIAIFPVPTRVELGEKDRLDRAREYAKSKLDIFLRVVEKEKYWSDVEVLYQPYYAYEEILATFGDKVGQSNSILAKMEQITDNITVHEVKKLVAPTEDEREKILEIYLQKYKLEKDTPPKPVIESYPKYTQPQTSPKNDHFFISYSASDALDFARKLTDELEGRHPFINTWIDKRDISPGNDWDDQLIDAIRNCKAMLFILTKESVSEGSPCKQEWSAALRYKKTVILLKLHKEVEIPYRLSNRQWIEFSSNFEAGVAKLRKAIAWLDTPEGALQSFKDRLTDAERDIRRASSTDQPRIQAEIEELKRQIEVQQKIVDNPKAAEEQTKKNIEAGLERERNPEKLGIEKTLVKYINPPPSIAPIYFQDRHLETAEIIKFLQDESQRLITIVGRGGVGKTAMVCRLLKGLEGGELPDGLGAMKVDGIVYLSESGSHRVTFANLFYDLCKLVPSNIAQELDAIYKNPQVSTESKMRALLEKLGTRSVVLLLDNIELLVNTETFLIRDTELDESLRAFLNGSHTAVKIIITARIAPRALNLIQPGRQRVLTLDEGLQSPYAENILRDMDSDGRLGLKSAEAEVLNRARIKTLGFPRALEALFAILASDRYTTLEELLAMPLPENVVEALVGEAFNRLDTNAQKVMQALAVYNRPVTPIAVDYLLTPHIPAMDSAPILQRLANMHFSRKESGRYYLQPIDREFAFSLIPKASALQKPNTGKSIEIKEFNQHDLILRAADFFTQARKPRAEWRKLDDLASPLAEFDLRCAVGDYDTAVAVLLEIDFDYLLLWGHYRLMIQMHEKVTGKIEDLSLQLGNLNGLGMAYLQVGDSLKSINYFEQGIVKAQQVRNSQIEGVFIGNLGLAYESLGNTRKAIEFYEQALVINREIGDRYSEGTDLGNLGLAYESLGNAGKAIEFYEQSLVINREIGDRRGEGNSLGRLGSYYATLGDSHKAIEFYEQALTIRREIGNRSGEAIDLENKGNIFLSLENYQKALDDFQQAIQIADEISFPQTQQGSHVGLAKLYLFINDLDNARVAIETAFQFDVPNNNHNTSALHGIIALRQGDEVTARGAFVRAIGQADEILSKTAEFYSALDAKGLALSGLAILGDPSGFKNPKGLAIETFRAARKIAPHAGIVKSVLRLFDELAKCDKEGILKDVRKVISAPLVE